ncbi:hypothetical protein QQ045_026090 [Rhodiola kirilowii]
MPAFINKSHLHQRQAEAKTLASFLAKMPDREASDSDAPEEFTKEEGLQLEQGIRKIQKENKERLKREGKERRKKWSENKTPKPSPAEVVIQDEEEEDEEEEEPHHNKGMLPKDIIDHLAAREKQTFSSDSEEDYNEEKKRLAKKKRAKTDGTNAIILNNLPPPPCLQNGLDFLKKRKMQVPRSNAVLNNSSKALRLMYSSGLLK